MRTQILILIALLLTAFVLQTAIRIEVLNAQAGYYLPRDDRNSDGTFSDGNWRISSDNSPRDKLRGVVETFGLIQYLLAPLLLILATFLTIKSKQFGTKVLGFFSAFISVIAVWLTLYREYFQSLGW